jgi:hypothetical protein
MAWRIHKSVVKGEIDNREKGRLTGRIWLYGREEPVILELTGNAWRDLAGQRLSFTNPYPKPLPEHMQSFASEQTGVVGDMTAARKVKRPDIPEDQIGYYCENKIPMPYHWSNSVYLEWHSARNGHVVIESGDYALTIEPEATWSMSEEEETEQRAANGWAMSHFIKNMLEAAHHAAETDPFDEKPELHFPVVMDDDTPQSRAEADADAEAAWIDLLKDRIMARLEREPDADAEVYARIMEKERERLIRERGDPEPKTSWLPDYDLEFIETEKWNAQVAETFAKEDEPIDDEPDDPLVEQCRDLGHRLKDDIDGNDWLPEYAQEEHPLKDLVHHVWFANAKLAGALHNGVYSWPPDALVAGNALVRLKKAREYLNDACAAVQATREDKLAPTNWLNSVRLDLEKICAEVRELIRDARQILREAENEQE